MAHFEITGGGAALFDDGTDRMARADESETGVGKDFLLLIGAGSPHVFFKPTRDESAIEEDPIPPVLGGESAQRLILYVQFTRAARIPSAGIRDFDRRYISIGQPPITSATRPRVALLRISSCASCVFSSGKVCVTTGLMRFWRTSSSVCMISAALT